MQKVTCRFEGRVQGVGFRYSTQELARAYPEITGQVRNLSDGSVELIAEGQDSQIQALLSDIAERMQRNIVRRTDQWESITERRYEGFRIADNGPA